jgi:TRAP-type C4-dicarboxylate transport system permease small subunit
MKIISKLFDAVLAVSSYIGICLILFAFVTVSAEVVARYFFNESIFWVFEFTEYIMGMVAFLTAAWVLEKEGHVCLDFVLNFFSPRVKAVMNIITSIIGFDIAVLITWFGATNARYHFLKGTVTMDKRVVMPYWILMAIIPLGFALLSIQFLRRAYKFYKMYKSQKEIEITEDITELVESV